MSDFSLYEQLKRSNNWSLEQDFEKVWNEGFDTGFAVGSKKERDKNHTVSDAMSPCCICLIPDQKSTSSDGIEFASCGCRCHKVEKSIKVYE